MSGPTPQRHCTNTKGSSIHRVEDDSSGYDPASEMDLSGPTSLTQPHSTGTTPIKLSSVSNDDHYSPPMSTIFLPDQEMATGLKELTSFIDQIAASAASTKAPTGQTYNQWKDFLFSSHTLDHEDYSHALFYAVEIILKAEPTSFSPLPSSSQGIVTGMPLTTVLWDDVKVETMEHMSTMAVKSGILQTCTALHYLHYLPDGKKRRDSATGGSGKGEIGSGEIDLGMDFE